jgi:hypothetical protein
MKIFIQDSEEGKRVSKWEVEGGGEVWWENNRKKIHFMNSAMLCHLFASLNE